MQDKLTQLKNRLARISDLDHAQEILNWDMEVMMPSGGADSRADQIATLETLTHQYFVDEEVGALLEDLQPYADSLPYESDDASVIRVTKRDFDKEVRVP